MAISVMTRIEDLNRILNQALDHRRQVLDTAAKDLKSWTRKVHKIKSIYHVLNLFSFDVTKKCLIAECWVPVADIESIKEALRRGTQKSASSVLSILNRMEKKEIPPTYNRPNEFTKGFQVRFQIVDSRNEIVKIFIFGDYVYMKTWFLHVNGR